MWPLLGVQLFVLSSLKPFLLSFRYWIDAEEAAKTKTRVMLRVEAGGCRRPEGRRQQRHGSRLNHYLSRQKTRTTKNVQGDPAVHLQADAFASAPQIEALPISCCWLLSGQNSTEQNSLGQWDAAGQAQRPWDGPCAHKARTRMGSCTKQGCAGIPCPGEPAATPGHRRPQQTPPLLQGLNLVDEDKGCCSPRADGDGFATFRPTHCVHEDGWWTQRLPLSSPPSRSWPGAGWNPAGTTVEATAMECPCMKGAKP